jgi:hypothetical protein
MAAEILRATVDDDIHAERDRVGVLKYRWYGTRSRSRYSAAVEV